MAKRSKGRNSYSKPDHYAQKAKSEGYAARSVYKLQSINQRAQIFRPGMKVVDLGCFPGSWSKYAIEKIGRSGSLVGVDFQAPVISGGHFLPKSIYDVTHDELVEILGGEADVVMSDMAPNTKGTRDADHYGQIELVRAALDVARRICKEGGSFVCKVFEGPDAQDVQQETKQLFRKVKRMRPDAVRKESREWFLVGQERKGTPEEYLAWLAEQPPLAPPFP